MGMRDLEKAVFKGSKTLLLNPKLKMKDIMEWSTGSLVPQEGEIVFYISSPGVYVCVKSEMDKRPKQKENMNRCRSCDDEFSSFYCKMCKIEIVDRCITCHAEKQHGVIPMLFMKPQCSSKPSPADEVSGYQSNAIREMEDGR